MDESEEPRGSDRTVASRPGRGERGRAVLGALDSGLALALPVTCLLLAVGVGWTYAYVPDPRLLVGAACFVAAGVAGHLGLRPRAEGGLGTVLQAASLVLAVAGVVCLVTGVH